MDRINETQNNDVELTAMLFRHMTESAHAPALFVVDLNDGYRICHASASSSWLLAQGDHLPGSIPTLTSTRLKQIWRTVCKSGTFVMETDFCTAHGHKVIEITFSRLENDIRFLMAGHIRDITEHRRTEEMLALHEQEFRSLAENLPDNIARWDIDGRYLYSNPTHQRTMGKTLEEMLGKTHAEIFSDDRYAPFKEVLAQVISTRQERQMLRVPVPGSSTEYHDVRLAPEFDGEGRVISVLGIGRDMTDVYQMQETIARHEQEFRSLAESSPNSIIRYDREGRIRYLNSGLARVLGVSDTAEIIGKLPSEAWPDGRYDAIQQAAAQALETEAEVCIEVCAQSAREPDFYQIRVVPELDIAGQVIGTIAFGVDITAIRRAERRLADFVANFPGFAYSFCMSPDGHASFPFASPGIEKFYGLKPEDVKEDMTPLHNLAHPEDAPRIMAAVAESARTMLPLQAELRVCRPGFPERWVECRSMPMAEADGSIIWHGIMLDITERKRIETRLALQDHALDHVSEAVYLVDEDARILQVNKAASSMLGYTQDELLAMRIYDIDTDFGPEKWRQHWDDLLVRGTITLETNHRNRMGNLVPIEVNANFITHEGRYYNYALVRDISERKQAQNAIQRSQSALKEAQRIAHIGSWEVDMVNDVLTWSDETFRIWEIDKTQFAATFSAFLETVHPEDREKVARAYNQSIIDKSLYKVEHRLLFPDGRVKYIQELGEPYFDQDGRPMRFIGTSLEITERKQAELALIAREREFRTLVENLPTYVVRLDHDLRRIYVNPAYLKMVGLPAADILGRHVSAFWRAENVSVDAYIALLTKVLRSGMQEELTLEWRDGAGRLSSHLVRVSPEFSANGKVQGLLVLGFDITERSRQQALEVERQRVFETIAHGGELNETLKQVARYVESAKSGRYCCILLPDEDGSRLISVAAPSLPVPCQSSQEGIELCEDSGCCATAALRGERIVVENFSHHAYQKSCQAFVRENRLAACWSEPILASSGKALGVVVIYREQAAEADSQDLTLLRHAGYLSSIAIERKRLESRMLYQASYDSLTDLPNRRLLGQRLRAEIAKSERTRESLALFFIDLDRFKEVNDTLGHDVGDLLLTTASQRIRACVRESDTVARLGGDEFVVILTQVEDISHLGRLAQNIIDDMAQPFYLGDHTAYVTASIGIAGYPLDADGAESLIGCADQAMYAAKAQGRNNFRFFTSAMQQQVQARMLLANDLHDALVNDQFQVWYQPIVDIATGEVVKAEALLRWKHPLRGMVPPDKFIPIAEENGLIHDIGDWVFCQAVQMVQRWNAGSQFRRQISVNLSPRQFLNGNLDAAWLEHLKQLDVDPAQITIEITEGLLLDDRPEIMQTLARLGLSGMQVALDDFGTGYSAMAYLKKFPIDYLKIDRSFVRDLEIDPGDRAIAEAIVVMAHKLGIKVIAEGVETTGQRDLLAAVGCEYVQGNFYGMPMPEEDFLTFVAQAY